MLIVQYVLYITCVLSVLVAVAVHRLQEVNSSRTEERTQTSRASGHGSSSIGSSLWGTGSRCSSRSAATGGRSKRSASLRLTRSKWSTGDGGCATVSGRAGTLAIGVGSSGIVGVQDLVDDVDDAVGDEYVGDDNLSVVNKDAVTADSDGDILAVDGLEGSAVHELGGVPNCTGDDMVG